MKKIFKRIAGYFVTIYANKLYCKAVNAADLAHAERGGRIYVVSDLQDVSKLVVLDVNRFREMKKVLKTKDSLHDLKQGAWYYTADIAEKNPLPEADREARRLAFVRHLLDRAGLI